MTSPVIQFKRGLLANLPGLRAGEPGFTTDSYDLYVGIDSTTSNNKFFGSHRYWTRGTASTGSGVNFVEGTNNGTSYITLKAADSLAGITTFTLPSADGSSGQFLKTNGSGVLSFDTVSSTLSIAGGTGTDTVTVGTDTLTFAGTASEIETTVTNNQVQIGLPNVVSITTSVVVGSGVTINASGINAAAGIITASSFVSNVLTGTAPISVASSTRVDNLNAQYVGGFAAPTSQVIGSSDTQTLTNKSIALGSNTITGTLAEFNTALTDADFVSIAGTETLTNKTLTSPILTTPSLGIASATSIAVSGISTFNNVVVGGATTALVVNGDARVIGILTIGSASITLSGVNNQIAGITTFTGFADLNEGVNVDGHTELDELNVSGVTTLSSAKVSNLTSGRVVLAGTSGALEDSANLTFSAGGLVVGAGGINVTGVSTFSTDLVVGGDLQITGNDIKSSTGAVAITLADNDVTVADDLTVGGNLYVNGSTTQVNTAALTVEDRTIDLGIVNGSAPSGATTWDLGVLFNYYASGAAKKSAVIWEHVDSRFKFASVLSADTDGSNVNTPQLTVTTFAPIEIASLFVNDCAGASQVISCTGTTRNLENITIDCGSF